MNRTLGQNQFARRTHASLNEVPTVGGPVGASYYHVRVHLRLSVLEGDVARSSRTQAGSYVFFSQLSQASYKKERQWH
jgi:hypothetical protein